jgi:hypothetical protein
LHCLEAGDESQQGGFPAAGWPEQGCKAAGAQSGRDAVEYGLVTESVPHLPDLQERAVGGGGLGGCDHGRIIRRRPMPEAAG